MNLNNDNVNLMNAINTQTYKLIKKRWVATYNFSDIWIHGMTDVMLRDVFEEGCKQLAFSFVHTYAKWVTGKTQTITIEYKVPKTWWQHFKLEKFPKWLLKRYPVIYETACKAETYTIDNLYPTHELPAWMNKNHFVVVPTLAETKEWTY